MSTLDILIERGRKEGIQKYQLETIQFMYKEGLSIAQIARILKVSEKFVKDNIKLEN